MACMMRPFAEADPVPFAVAILNAKSLTLLITIADLGLLISDQSRIVDRRLIRNPLDPRSEIVAYRPTASNGMNAVPAYGSSMTALRMSHA
jgi:hypothetical protein